MEEGLQAEGAELAGFPPYKNPELMGPIALAFIGDAVHELYIRQYLLSLANHRPNHLHRQSTQYVSAKAQAKLLAELMPELTEEEQAVVKRGRNAHSGTSPKNTDVADYRQSTAFECLLGYLYYQGKISRINELLNKSIPIVQGGI